jgi:hypothetical protein
MEASDYDCVVKLLFINHSVLNEQIDDCSEEQTMGLKANFVLMFFHRIPPRLVAAPPVTTDMSKPPLWVLEIKKPKHSSRDEYLG